MPGPNRSRRPSRRPVSFRRIAVSLDASDANALAGMGIVSLFVRRRRRLEYLNRAIGLNPNLATAHGYLAAVHGSMGNSAAASAAAEAIHSSPLDSTKPLWLAGKGIGALINERYERNVGRPGCAARASEFRLGAPANCHYLCDAGRHDTRRAGDGTTTAGPHTRAHSLESAPDRSGDGDRRPGTLA